MRLKSFALTSIATLALVACSGATEEPNANEGEVVEAEAPAAHGEGADTGAAADEGAGTAVAEEEPVEVEEPLASCHGGATTYCRGPVMVKASNMVLSKDRDVGAGRADLSLKATFTVENRTDAPIQFTLLTREVTQAVLANGFTLSGNRSGRNIGGLTACNERDVSQCILTQPDDFVVLQPGESPATFNVTYTERANAETMASVPRVESTDANIQLVVVDASGSSRKISVAFTGAPVFNNLAN